MKFKFEVRLGDRVIEIEDEAASAHDVWRKIAFWDSLPSAGPNGEADLRFSHRTPQGYEFFALECRSAGQEFKFGQKKDDKQLFPKGWEPIQHGADDHEEDSQPARQSAPAPARQAQPVSSAPAPAANNASWTAKHAALADAIREVGAYHGADTVAGRVNGWTRGRSIEDLTADEAQGVLNNVNGWLVASKKAMRAA